MSFANRTAQALLNSLFGKTSNFGTLASAPTLYVGLSTSDPGESGTLTGEPDTTGSYARVTTAATDWNAATLADPSVMDNANTISFPASTAAWSSGASPLTHFFIADGATPGAGNVLLSAALTTSRTVNASGVTLSFAAGALDVTLD